MNSSNSGGALGYHELPVHSADDIASRQQKMLQQRQLALKRQQALTKNIVGAGVTAQLNSPMGTSPEQHKVLGWGKRLPAGVDGSSSGAENLPLKDASGLVRMVVPHASEEASYSLSARGKSERALQDIGNMATTEEPLMANADFQRRPSPLETPRVTPRAAEASWDIQSLGVSGSSPATGSGSSRKGSTENSEKMSSTGSSWTSTASKSARRMLWTPWGKKRSTAATGPIVEETRVVVLSAEAKEAQENSGARHIDRSATPWQGSNDACVEESIDSDISSIPGVAETSHDFTQDRSPGSSSGRAHRCKEKTIIFSSGPLGMGLVGADVVKIVKGSQAEAYGIQVGYRLLALGGEPVPVGADPDEIGEWVDMWLRKPRPLPAKFAVDYGNVPDEEEMQRHIEATRLQAQHRIAAANAKIQENDCIDRDQDESTDSGVEQTVHEWKTQVCTGSSAPSFSWQTEQGSPRTPSEKRSRLNRFIPNVHPTKFWRMPKGQVRLPGCSETRTPVVPAGLPDLDLD